LRRILPPKIHNSWFFAGQHLCSVRMSRRNFTEYFPAHGLIWMGLLVMLVFNCCLRWHLREMPLERDEGEYAYAGQLILQGIPPYHLAWNMKFPGVYFAYATLMSVFGQSAPGIHLGLIVVTSISTLLMFLIGRELMNPIGGLMAAAFLTLLSALPFAYGLAGHATHFVVLFVCAGFFGLLKGEKQRPLFWTFISGTAFGVAILMKQHAFIFTTGAFTWVAWQASRRGQKAALPAGIFIIGVAVPLLLTFALLALAGVWGRFNFWTIRYAREYVSIFPLRSVPHQFAAGFGPVFHSGIWVWVAGVVGLGLVFLRTEHRRAAILGTGLFLAGLLAACPGFYFRGHYFLMAMPGLALLNAVWLLAIAGRLKTFPQIRLLKILPAGLFFVVAGDLLVRNADSWFRLTPFEITRKLYGFSPFPESPEIAGYITAHTKPDDTIAVLGSEPQIFFLAHRHSASGYIYVYPLTEPQPLAPVMRQEFKKEIEAAQPKYVVHVNILSSWCSAVVPGQTEKILDDFQKWWGDYSQNYRLVGVVDIAEDKPAEFFWDEQLSSRTNTSPAEISIFRRK
jgi:Dolichyl-phosphate-mannose-protein mannosyltransferase